MFITFERIWHQNVGFGNKFLEHFWIVMVPRKPNFWNRNYCRCRCNKEKSNFNMKIGEMGQFIKETDTQDIAVVWQVMW